MVGEIVVFRHLYNEEVSTLTCSDLIASVTLIALFNELNRAGERLVT